MAYHFSFLKSRPVFKCLTALEYALICFAHILIALDLVLCIFQCIWGCSNSSHWRSSPMTTPAHPFNNEEKETALTPEVRMRHAFLAWVQLVQSPTLLTSVTRRGQYMPTNSHALSENFIPSAGFLHCLKVVLNPRKKGSFIPFTRFLLYLKEVCFLSFTSLLHCLKERFLHYLKEVSFISFISLLHYLKEGSFTTLRSLLYLLHQSSTLPEGKLLRYLQEVYFISFTSLLQCLKKYSFATLRKSP